jgi:hypothetical protein
LKNDALEAIIFDYNLQPVDTKIFNNDTELKLYSFYGFSFYLGQDTVVYETEPEVALEDPETASLTIKTGIKQRVLQVQDELDFILHGVEITIPFETALNVIKTYLHRDAEIIRACDIPTK